MSPNIRIATCCLAIFAITASLGALGTAVVTGNDLPTMFELRMWAALSSAAWGFACVTGACVYAIVLLREDIVVTRWAVGFEARALAQRSRLERERDANVVRFINKRRNARSLKVN